MRTVGSYQILEQLGEGAMGAVYRAVDVHLDRVVALKSVRREVASQPQFIDRFREEAKIQARLESPNIVRLYQFLQEGDEYFMVMEFVKGRSLSKLLHDQGRVVPEQAVSLMIQTLEGLGYAHARHVVHRDVKPANIMVNDEGVVKVADFGIARILGSSRQRLTQVGGVVGTLEYMSPETLMGEDATGPSDLYSCGIVLYQLLMGQLPFKHDNDWALVEMHRTQAPPPLTGVPKMLEAAILKALAKKPADRFATAAEMAKVLRTWLQTTDGGSERADSGLWDRLRSLASSRPSSDTGLSHAPPPSGATSESRRRIISSVSRRVDELLTQQNWQEAQSEVERRIAEFPTEAALVELRERIARERRYYEGDLQSAIQEGQTLLQRGLPDLAKAALESSLKRYTGHAELKSLLARAENDLLVRAASSSEVQMVSTRVGELLQREQFQEAVRYIADAVGRLPNQPELVTLLSRTVQAEREHAKQQVVDACRQRVLTFHKSGDWTKAFEAIDQALVQHPGDKALLELRQETEREREARLRAAEIQFILTQVEELKHRNEIDAAEELLQEGLTRFPREPSLTQVLSAIRSGKAIQQARALRDQSDWDNAFGVLAKALQETPKDPALMAFRAETEQLRDKQIFELRSAIENGAALLKAGKLEDALMALSEASQRYPQDPAILKLLVEAQQKMAAERRERQLQQISSKATDLLASGAFDEAEQFLLDAIPQYPDDPRLTRSLTAAIQGRRDLEKKRFVTKCLERAQSLGNQGNLADAIKELESGLSRYPGDSSLETQKHQFGAALREERRGAQLSALREQVNRLLKDHSFDAALASISDALREYPGDGDFRSLETKVRETQRSYERDRAEADTQRRVAELEKSSQFEEAWTLVQSAFALHPDSTSLAKLRDAVDQHRQAAIRQQSIDRAESEIRKLIAAKEWSAASEAARQAMADFPDASTFARLRQDAEAALKEQIEAAAKARAKQLEELLRKATELTKNEEFAGALETIRNATLNDAETRPFRQLLDKAQAGLRQQQIDLENKARREEAIAAALREATGLLAVRSWTKATEVLGNAARTLGEDSRLSDFTARVQREQQEHRENVQNILSEARFLCDSEEYDQAIDRLEKGIAQSPNEPELERALAETQQRAPAFRKAARLSSIEAAAQSLLSSGQWERAEAILQEALRDLPGESALLALLNTAQSAGKRNEGIQKCAKTVQVHLDADPERAKELLTEGLQTFPDSDVLRGLRLPVVLAQAARRLELDTPKSALQVLEALGGRAKEPAVAALMEKCRQRIQDQEEELRQALSKAEALLQKGQGEEALGVLTEAPPELEDDSRLRTLRERAAGMIAALKKAADEISEVRRLLKSAGPEAAFKKIGQVSQAARARPEFAALEEECRVELKKLQAATRAVDAEALRVAEQAAQATPAAPVGKTPKSKAAKPAAKQTPPAAEPAPTPEPKAAPPVQPAPPTRVVEAKKPLPVALIIGGAVAAAAVVGIVIWMSGGSSSTTTTTTPPPSNASVRVDIRTDPQGATIHVGDQTCQTPNCSLTLSPGTYQVQAELNGFEPATKPLTVASGKTADALELSLRPVIVPPPPVDPSQASGTLVVQTGLEGALVYIDGAARDRTDASGKYTTTLDVATHRVQVEKTGYGKSPEQTVKIAKGQSVTRTFKLTAELARLDLRGAPAGVDVRVNGSLLGRTDGGAVFSRPVTPTAGDLSIQVTEGSASKQIFQRFNPGQTVSIEWVNIAPVNTQKQAEEKARLDAEQKKQAADEQARRDAEQKKQAADEQARRDAEQKKQAADEQARREAEQKKQAADEQARRDAEKNKQTTDNGAKEREAAAARLVADRKAILTTLKETETAYGARNMLQLSQFWPAFASSQPVVALFANKDVTKITMELRPKGDPQVTGDTARITVDQIMTQTYKQGSPPPIPPVTRTVNLVRKPQGWVIDSVK